LKDPETLAETKKSNLEIEPIDGPNMTKMFAKLYELDPAMIEFILPKKN